MPLTHCVSLADSRRVPLPWQADFGDSVPELDDANLGTDLLHTVGIHLEDITFGRGDLR